MASLSFLSTIQLTKKSQNKLLYYGVPIYTVILHNFCIINEVLCGIHSSTGYCPNDKSDGKKFKLNGMENSKGETLGNREINFRISNFRGE